MDTKNLIFILGFIFLIFLFYFFGIFSWVIRVFPIEGFVGEKVSTSLRLGGLGGDIFVDQEEFEQVVNKSDYFYKLNPWDLRVRADNLDRKSYKIKYMNSRVEMTKKQKDEIISLIEYVDGKGDDEESGGGLGIASSILGKIPWKIVIYDGSVEGSLCHTIGDIIMFPIEYFDYTKNRKISLLIHEKTHILQRLYPEWAEKVSKDLGFSRIGKHDDGSLGWMEDIRRHNPDLNSYDYGLKNGVGDILNGGRIVELYTGNSSLLDSATFMVNRNLKYILLENTDIGIPSYVGQIEHPYEIMACMIPELVIRFSGGDVGEMTTKEKIIWNALWNQENL